MVRAVPLIHYTFITANGVNKVIKDKATQQEISAAINKPFVIQDAAGVFNEAQIPSIDASKITGMVAAEIPNLDSSKITTGTFGSAFIADGAITTAKLADGAVTNAKVSSVDASKVTTIPVGIPFTLELKPEVFVELVAVAAN